MNPTCITPCSISGLTSDRSFRPRPLPSAPALSRAGLPVVSNRALLARWMTRPGSLGSVRLAKLR